MSDPATADSVEVPVVDRYTPQPPPIEAVAEPVSIGANEVVSAAPARPEVTNPPGRQGPDPAELARRRNADLDQLEAVISVLTADSKRLLPIRSALYGIDLGRFAAMLNALTYFAVERAAEKPVRDQVLGALKALRVWFYITPGENDDQLINRIDHLIGDPVTGAPAVDALAEFVSKGLGICREVFEAAAVDAPIETAIVRGISILMGPTPKQTGASQP